LCLVDDVKIECSWFIRVLRPFRALTRTMMLSCIIVDLDEFQIAHRARGRSLKNNILGESP